MNSSAPAAAVLGGSFDPIHLGHIRIARMVRAALGIDRVQLLLSPRPPHKGPDELSDTVHRAAMVQLALPQEPGWSLCRYELDRDAVGYTIETLRALRAERELEPIFILGMDSLSQLASWRDHAALVDEFDLAVVDREGSSLADARERLDPEVAKRLVPVDPANLPIDLGRGGRIFHLTIEPIRISSSRIRKRVARNEPLDDLVHPAVARYIQTHRLYRGTEESALSNSLPRPILETIEAAQDKKACDLQILDLHGLSDVTDYFILCHGSSDRQVAAIADGIEDRLRESLKLKPISVEGRQTSEWILLDYVDFVIHVFTKDKREFYRLDRLWGDAPTYQVDAAPAPAPSGTR